MLHVISCDFGTTGVKTCLFRISDTIEMIENAYGSYGLYILDGGGAEQDADEWWSAMCQTTRELIAKADITAEEIDGISFCSQMQGLVLVDKYAKAVRRPMSYMDQRASEQMKKCQGHGIKISGANVFMLLKSLSLTGAASTSVKDPIWKYKWVQENEPENFTRVYKWLDVKEYLIARCTGKFVMTRDSAYATFLYQTKKGKGEFSPALCKMYGVNMDHMPDIIESSDQAGVLTEKASAELGLAPGTPVFGGGGDASLIGVGAGAAKSGQTHIYSGTSGWVGTVIDKQVVDISAMIAGIVGVSKDRYTYFAEMETAGKCFEWVKDHLALDEIDIYLEKHDIAEDPVSAYRNLYEYMTSKIAEIGPGAGGVIFTPWLHGNRCPFEDPNSSGMFFNIGLDTGKTEMIRAVQEGICYHLRWMLECEDKKIKTSNTVRFVGGGAVSNFICQMLADITGRTVETVPNPQDAGAVGAALLASVGRGLFDNIEQASELIKPSKTFVPNMENKRIYDKNYAVFKDLYKSNKKNFKNINKTDRGQEI